ncbi:MAG: RES family NAD+ phosphorylase [Candidatus Elarobacter sp.]
MAPFAYPSASRFGDGLAGVYYAGDALATAIAEVSFHRERFARSTPTPPMDFDERVIEADIDADLVDLRRESATSALYDPDPANYTGARIVAKKARVAGAHGLVYNSVRRPGGECVAVFAPRLIVDARTTGYIGLRWDGKRIIDHFRKESLTAPYPSM